LIPGGLWIDHFAKREQAHLNFPLPLHASLLRIALGELSDA
jgi:hypothetical protein